MQASVRLKMLQHKVCTPFMLILQYRQLPAEVLLLFKSWSCFKLFWIWRFPTASFSDRSWIQVFFGFQSVQTGTATETRNLRMQKLTPQKNAQKIWHCGIYKRTKGRLSWSAASRPFGVFLNTLRKLYSGHIWPLVGSLSNLARSPCEKLSL